eukprot:6316078-Prymnesium_polylepis.1
MCEVTRLPRPALSGSQSGLPLLRREPAPGHGRGERYQTPPAISTPLNVDQTTKESMMLTVLTPSPIGFVSTWA